jgi:hypothetical protein
MHSRTIFGADWFTLAILLASPAICPDIKLVFDWTMARLWRGQWMSSDQYLDVNASRQFFSGLSQCLA